jgi:hypothetical protein
LYLGERALALMIAPDTKQAKIAKGYASAFINQSPVLRSIVDNEAADTISLTNGNRSSD